jgi:hypothetical protein
VGSRRVVGSIRGADVEVAAGPRTGRNWIRTPNGAANSCWRAVRENEDSRTQEPAFPVAADSRSQVQTDF